MSTKKLLAGKIPKYSLKQKAFMKLLDSLRKSPGFPVNLDFLRGKYTFSGHGFGGGVPADDRFTITIYGTADKYAYPLATIGFDRARWQEFKKLGDGLIKGSRKHRQKKSRKKK